MYSQKYVMQYDYESLIFYIKIKAFKLLRLKFKLSETKIKLSANMNKINI